MIQEEIKTKHNYLASVNIIFDLISLFYAEIDWYFRHYFL